jgi:hypothetical protein
MFSLLKGDCEHCGQIYRYSILHAGFGDYSYAYCDTCGNLATIGYSSSHVLTMPQISSPHQVIDAEWEPFLRPCDCGGHFRKGASPRCVFCTRMLSADHAASHIERNFIAGGRGWRWQRNWTDVYCMDIEDPSRPGLMRQVSDPFIDHRSPPGASPKKGWFGLFKSSK